MNTEITMTSSPMQTRTEANAAKRGFLIKLTQEDPLYSQCSPIIQMADSTYAGTAEDRMLIVIEMSYSLHGGKKRTSLTWVKYPHAFMKLRKSLLGAKKRAAK